MSVYRQKAMFSRRGPGRMAGSGSAKIAFPNIRWQVWDASGCGQSPYLKQKSVFRAISWQHENWEPGGSQSGLLSPSKEQRLSMTTSPTGPSSPGSFFVLVERPGGSNFFVCHFKMGMCLFPKIVGKIIQSRRG